jgi:uncharacterized iron-regulated membrane protein
VGDDVMRAAWAQVHLWLGLTLGIVGVFIGITGSILVFDSDIDALLNPQRYGTSGPQVAKPFSEYAASAAAASEGRARATLIRLPEAQGMPVVVFARGRGEGGGGQYRVYLDPPTGRVLEAVQGGGFIGWVHGFHENLSLREYFGREIVGAVGIAMLISSLSGLFLWWPGRGRFASSLGFRRGLPVTRNLHYVFGFYGFVMLAMLSFTGIFIAYTEAGRAMVAVFAPLSAPARNIQAPEGPRAAKPISVNEAVGMAKELYPAEKVWSVGLPAGPRGTYRVNLSEPGVTSMQAGRGTVVFVDPGSGAILRRVDASTRTGGDNFLTLQRTLHSGEPFGVLGRAVICVAGLLPGLFVVTGSLMWLRQRRAQRS